MEFSNKRALGDGLTLGMLAILSSMAWWYVARGLEHEAVNWFVAAGWYTALVVWACVAALFTRHIPWSRPVIALLVFFPIVLWSQEWFVVVGIVFSVLLSYVGLSRMFADLQERVKISVRKSLPAGMPLMVLGLAVALTTQYYAHVHTLPVDNLLPRFTLGQTTNGMVIRMLASFNPAFKKAESEHVTLDEFLLALQNGGVETQGSALEEEVRSAGFDPDDLLVRQALEQYGFNHENEAALAASRAKFSQLAGMRLSGTEKISDVLTAILNYQMHVFFDPEARGYASSSLLPFVLSLLLFLTLLPLGSLLSFVWVLLATLVFHLAVRLGWITIRTVPAEREMIE